MFDICVTVLEWGFSPEHTNIRCSVRGMGALSYGPGQAVAQSGVVAKLRMGLWNPEVGVWAISLKWGLLSSSMLNWHLPNLG